MQLIGFVTLVICWGLFILIWGAGWIYNLLKAPKVDKRSSFAPISVGGILLILLLSRLAHLNSLDFVVSMSVWLWSIGMICLILSTGLTLWARFALSTMWSNQPETKIGHELRTSGPYHISRHPIYTGMIGMLLGSLVVSDENGFWAIATMIGFLIVLTKIPAEEKLMLETFGEQYKQYQQQVPQLIPGLQWLRRNFSGTKKI